MTWSAVQQVHSEAAADLARAAERVPPDKWLAPREEGKWSPAEIVEHLSLAYDVFLRELGGGAGMQIRTKLWQRIYLRLLLVPRLLRGEPFPAGARAPREIRPANPSPDQAAAVASFRDRAARFDAATDTAQRSGSRLKLTHAYFGSASLDDAVLLCARHVQHHRQQLPNQA